MAIPPKFDRRCALFEGIRQASIGTEPADIERAGEALRRVAPRHPNLGGARDSPTTCTPDKDTLSSPHETRAP
jgi:hypothetical protein